MIKALFKFGTYAVVAGGLLAGGTMLIAGPHRARAVLHKVTDDVRTAIDDQIDDPTALRTQLQELEREYPQRIAAVRTDLAELEDEMAQLVREAEVSRRVVAMIEDDLAELEPRVREAAAKGAEGVRPTLVSFDHHVLTLERASAKLDQIRATQIAYQNRAADAEHDLAYLRQQADRLGDLQSQLESERAQFQAQIWQLSRQVDAIARNERLIDLMEKRNRTIEECSRYDAVSLDQITDQLSRVRIRQEAELDLLSTSRKQVDYEERARLELRSGDVAPSSGPAGPRPAATSAALAIGEGR